jgi:hypothetical protein
MRRRIAVVPTAARSASTTVELSRWAMQRASNMGQPVLAASIVGGPATFVSALAPSFRRAGTTTVQRATSGRTFTSVGSVLHHALALPRVNTVSEDTTAATLLNRNVRGFLRGYTAAGALAHYFGADTISFARRPGALLGYDVAADGGFLLDVFTAYDAPLIVASGRDQTWTSYSAAAVVALEPAMVAARVHEGLCRYWQLDAEPISFDARSTHSAAEPPDDVKPSLRTAPEALHVACDEVTTPMGIVQARVIRHGGSWEVELRLDALVARCALAEVERVAAEELTRRVPLGDATVAPLQAGALHGALVSDVLSVLRGAAARLNP